MSNLSKRSTVNFEPAIHQALKIKAASSQLSISELVDNTVWLLMSEDHEDLAIFSARIDEMLVVHVVKVGSSVYKGN